MTKRDKISNAFLNFEVMSSNQFERSRVTSNWLVEVLLNIIKIISKGTTYEDECEHIIEVATNFIESKR